MTILTEEKLHRNQARLERLIDDTEDARKQSCNERRTELRDRLDRVGAHLRMARAEAGAIEFDGITTQSGGEK